VKDLGGAGNPQTGASGYAELWIFKKMGSALKPSPGLIIPIADVRNGTIKTGSDEVGMAGL
jgi:hypothetical protein